MYKNVEKLYEREQHYINLYDTKKNGLNQFSAKVIDNIIYNKERYKNYNVINSFFRKYGRQILRFKDELNDYFKTNKSFECYKKQIEGNKQLIKLFICLYCYDEDEEPELFNMLFNYVLYEQKARDKKYFYELVENNDVVDSNELKNKGQDNIIIDFIDSNDFIIDFIDSNDFIYIDVIDAVIDIK